MAMTGLEMGLLGLGGAKALLGGGQVSVPGSIARPTDPTAKFVDESGMLREQFRTAGLTNKDMQEGRGLLGQLKGMATSTGPTAQAKALMGASQIEQQAQRDQAARDQASQRATAEANLAMKGGLGTGARERLAAQTAQTGLAGQQDLNRQGALNRLNIQAQDEARKFGLLKDLPGQYLNLGERQLQRQASDIQGGMGLLQNKYAADMQSYAANQMARAQAQAANAANQGLLGSLGF